MNILCAVDVSSQPEGTLPDLQSTKHAVQMIKEIQMNKTKQVMQKSLPIYQRRLILFPLAILSCSWLAQTSCAL